MFYHCVSLLIFHIIPFISRTMSVCMCRGRRWQRCKGWAVQTLTNLPNMGSTVQEVGQRGIKCLLHHFLPFSAAHIMLCPPLCMCALPSNNDRKSHVPAATLQLCVFVCVYVSNGAGGRVCRVNSHSWNNKATWITALLPSKLFYFFFSWLFCKLRL